MTQPQLALTFFCMQPKITYLALSSLLAGAMSTDGAFGDSSYDVRRGEEHLRASIELRKELHAERKKAAIERFKAAPIKPNF